MENLGILYEFVYYTGHSLRNDVTPLYSTYGSLQSTSTYGSINGAMHKDMVNRWTGVIKTRIFRQ